MIMYDISLLNFFKWSKHFKKFISLYDVLKNLDKPRSQSMHVVEKWVFDMTYCSTTLKIFSLEIFDDSKNTSVASACLCVIYLISSDGMISQMKIWYRNGGNDDNPYILISNSEKLCVCMWSESCSLSFKVISLVMGSISLESFEKAKVCIRPLWYATKNPIGSIPLYIIEVPEACKKVSVWKYFMKIGSKVTENWKIEIRSTCIKIRYNIVCIH